MIECAYDHVHLRSLDPAAAGRFYVDVLGAKKISEVQVRGMLRVVLDLGGLRVFIEEAPAGLPQSPVPPFTGVEHIGLRVADLDAAVADLARLGIPLQTAIEQVNPALRVVFLEGPDRVRIELLERKAV